MIIDSGANDSEDGGVLTIERVDHGSALRRLPLPLFKARQGKPQAHFLYRVRHDGDLLFDRRLLRFGEPFDAGGVLHLRQDFQGIGTRSGVQQERFHVVATVLILQKRHAKLEHARLRIAVRDEIGCELFDLRTQCRAGRASSNRRCSEFDAGWAMAPLAYSRMARG